MYRLSAPAPAASTASARISCWPQWTSLAIVRFETRGDDVGDWTVSRTPPFFYSRSAVPIHATSTNKMALQTRYRSTSCATPRAPSGTRLERNSQSDFIDICQLFMKT